MVYGVFCRELLLPMGLGVGVESVMFPISTVLVKQFVNGE